VRDSAEQPQGLDVIPGSKKIGANEALRLSEITLREQASRLHELRRQEFERCEVLGRHGCAPEIAHQAIQTLEHAPALRQRRVDAHCPPQRRDGAVRIVQRDVAIALLLIEAPETRGLLTQLLEGVERFGDAVKASLIDRDQVHEITPARYRNRERFGGSERLAVPPGLGELADTAHLEHIRRGRCG
jgi:hypothetical protein